MSQGKAMEIFERVEEVFKANGIIYSIFISKKRNDVQNYFFTLPLSKLKCLDGIFCFSGDGHIHEVINALMKRQDFQMKKNIRNELYFNNI